MHILYLCNLMSSDIMLLDFFQVTKVSAAKLKNKDIYVLLGSSLWTIIVKILPNNMFNK